MGIDCSNCKCANREDESILIIDNSVHKINDKSNSKIIESKKDRLDAVKNSKDKSKDNKVQINMNIVLNVIIT